MEHKYTKTRPVPITFDKIETEGVREINFRYGNYMVAVDSINYYGRYMKKFELKRIAEDLQI